MIINYINEASLKKLKSYYFNKTDLNVIILDLIKNDPELYNYLLYPSFIISDNIVANYSFIDRIIRINLNRIKEISRNNIYSHYIKNKYLYVNLFILHVLFHEIEHAKQNYLINETNHEIKELFIEEIFFSNKNNNKYREYYEYFAVERDAQITSLENIIKLTYDIDETYLHIYYKNLLLKLLTKTYRNNTYPNYIISNYVLDSLPLKTTTLDFYERCKYGLELQHNEYKDLVLNYDDIIKEKIIKK